MPDLFHMRPELVSSEQARQKLGKKENIHTSNPGSLGGEGAHSRGTLCAPMMASLSLEHTHCDSVRHQHNDHRWSKWK